MEPSPPPPFPSSGQPPIAEVGYTCMRCGYNLSGAPVGGVCPECGTSVQQSLRGRTASGQTSGMAITCLIMGILGLTACGLLGPVAIVLHASVKRRFLEGLESESSMTMAKVGNILGIIATILLVLTIPCIGLMFTLDNGGF